MNTDPKCPFSHSAASASASAPATTPASAAASATTPLARHPLGARPGGPSTRDWGLGLLRDMRRDYLGFVGGLQREHPDAAYLRLAWQNITHLFHPDWVREVLVDQADALIRWPRATGIFSLTMGQSVLVTEGAQWQRQRRMLQPSFAPRRVNAYTLLMAQAARQALDGLATPPRGGQRSVDGGADVDAGMDVDVDALMSRITLDVILRTLFGAHQITDPAPIAQAIQTLSHYAIDEMFKPFSWPLWWPLPRQRRTAQARALLNGVIDLHIAQAQSQAQSAEPDHTQPLLTMLCQAHDPQHPEQGLSTQELRDQTMTLFLAGHETSATALTWWCGLIAQHPQVAQRLHHEIDTVLQGQDPSPEHLGHMPWLQASLKEAMRLYPPAAVLCTRRTLKPVTAGPWTVPAGEMIALTPYAIQRDARWFEAPDTFRPERFLPDAPDLVRGAYLPFGTGPRVCIGQHFAVLEMGLIAAMLLQRYSLHWPSPQPWPASQLGMTLRPATPIRLQLRARRQG